MAVTVDIKKKMGSFTLNIHFRGSARRIGFLGASGCGKSMTLKSIAGIETPDEGIIKVGDTTLFDSAGKINVKPQQRSVGYLFQNYALFPTMSVQKNIEAGLKGTRDEKRSRSEKMIHKFALDGLENRLPQELSGGQQQRVALARIMAYEPDVILLDEPFSALDVYLRDQLQQEMMELLTDYTGIVILVSHNRDEVYRFCEELLVMDAGGTVIYGKTGEIFDHPTYVEAARLTGCKNFSRILRTGKHTVTAKDWGISLTLDREIPEDATHVALRAHDFSPVWGERKKNCLQVCVESRADLPFERNYYLYPEGDKNRDKPKICWFIQREYLDQLEKKGMPDYLKVREEDLMFLK